MPGHSFGDFATRSNTQGHSHCSPQLHRTFNVEHKQILEGMMRFAHRVLGMKKGLSLRV